MPDMRGDRNRQVAVEAITLAERAIAELSALRGDLSLEGDLRAFHHRWEARGVFWTKPRPLTVDLDGYATADELAGFADVLPCTIRQWASRGLIGRQVTGGGVRYSVPDVIARIARRTVRASVC